jgi:hypothetical protein
LAHGLSAAWVVFGQKITSGMMIIARVASKPIIQMYLLFFMSSFLQRLSLAESVESLGEIGSFEVL